MSRSVVLSRNDLASSTCIASRGYVCTCVYVAPNTTQDCWAAKERDANGKLQPDPKRFPSGIKALADYVRHKTLLQTCTLLHTYIL